MITSVLTSSSSSQTYDRNYRDPELISFRIHKPDLIIWREKRILH